MPPTNGEEWVKNAKYVLENLRELKADVKTLMQRVTILEVKAALWGSLMGVLSSIITYIITRHLL